MLGKLAVVAVGYFITPVSGELTWDAAMYHHDPVLHDPRVWEHADNFTAYHMDHFHEEHHGHCDEHRDYFDDPEGKCDKCKCKKCIMKGAKFVMYMIAKKIKMVCSRSVTEDVEHGYEHGKMKEWFCMAAKKYPEVVMGYMAYKVRPVMMSMAWCAGAGYCKKEHKAHEIVYHGVSDEELAHEEHAFIEPQIHPKFSKYMNMIVDTYENYRMDLKEESEAENESIVARKLGEEYFNQEKVKVMDIYSEVPMDCPFDKRCLGETMKAVMGLAVKRFIGMCKKGSQKCPVLKKMCMFAGEHKKFVFGAMLAHVQPEKFAMGRCYKGKKENHSALGRIFQHDEQRHDDDHHRMMEHHHSMFDKIHRLMGSIMHLAHYDDHDVDHREVIVISKRKEEPIHI